MEIRLQLEEYQLAVADLIKDINFLPFYKNVGKILLDAVYTNFETDGAYFQRGTPWMPLAKSTIRVRERLGFTPINILRRRAGDAGLLGSINFTANNNYVEIGTNVFYAEYLHFGVPGRMPARPIFPENEFPSEVIEDIADAFNKLIKRHFQIK
ncbi:MAG: phage virion morphogenesis protein [Candidatus Kapabacteria bacterium]|nr:phage virion morphogenesis protein [Ignavibacteriota bacterium]MCW5886350.1 phage virion morphogenesis protein [Candidatus Kapabacteria bacterium]